MTPVDPCVPLDLVPPGSKPCILGKDQPEYENLPSIRTPNGYVISRWHPSEEERAKILRGEDIYLTVLTFATVQPVLVSVGLIDWTVGPFDRA